MALPGEVEELFRIKGLSRGLGSNTPLDNQLLFALLPNPERLSAVFWPRSLRLALFNL